MASWFYKVFASTHFTGVIVDFMLSYETRRTDATKKNRASQLYRLDLKMQRDQRENEALKTEK